MVLCGIAHWGLGDVLHLSCLQVLMWPWLDLAWMPFVWAVCLEDVQPPTIRWATFDNCVSRSGVVHLGSGQIRCFFPDHNNFPCSFLLCGYINKLTARISRPWTLKLRQAPWCPRVAHSTQAPSHVSLRGQHRSLFRKAFQPFAFEQIRF